MVGGLRRVTQGWERGRSPESGIEGEDSGRSLASPSAFVQQLL